MAELLSTTAAAVAFALLCWWFGTGAILWLVRRSPRSFPWSLGALTVLGGLGLWGSFLSMQAHGVAPAYLAFASVILMWSWHELAFLTGWVTGPRKQPLDPGATGARRFRQSVAAVLHHELALLANFVVLAVLQQGQPNHVALCTFALLWCMRLTAKLNLYFGVPQTGEQYLPQHLVYLGSYFRRGPASWFFYLTVALACAVWLRLVGQVQDGLVATTTGSVLLATLLGLAIVEHALMIFALPLQRLWGWAMAGHASAAAPRTADPARQAPGAAPPLASLPTLPAVAVGATPHTDTA